MSATLTKRERRAAKLASKPAPVTEAAAPVAKPAPKPEAASKPAPVAAPVLTQQEQPHSQRPAKPAPVESPAVRAFTAAMDAVSVEELQQQAAAAATAKALVAAGMKDAKELTGRARRIAERRAKRAAMDVEQHGDPAHQKAADMVRRFRRAAQKGTDLSGLLADYKAAADKALAAAAAIVSAVDECTFLASAAATADAAARAARKASLDAARARR